MKKGRNTMSKRKHKKTPPTALELVLTVRGNWNGVNPVTRIEENKKRKKPKHKKREMERAREE
jgi:hypothetical protein